MFFWKDNINTRKQFSTNVTKYIQMKTKKNIIKQDYTNKKQRRTGHTWKFLVTQ